MSFTVGSKKCAPRFPAPRLCGPDLRHDSPAFPCQAPYSRGTPDRLWQHQRPSTHRGFFGNAVHVERPAVFLAVATDAGSRRRQIRVERFRAAATLTSQVKALRQHLVLRADLVALLLVSWFVFTNCCALGMMPPAAQAATEPAPCCNGKAPPKQDVPGGPCACCKVKITSSSAKDGLKVPDAAKLESQRCAIFQVPAARPAPAVFILDHGPPGWSSFAETVLQRSLLSHAPPRAV